ncbi:MAG: S8 family serine peptidase [Elusimicrobia bacterium]|nr:S8 family serine peptidase [Elusimicrobiota bacterium]
MKRATAILLLTCISIPSLALGGASDAAPLAADQILALPADAALFNLVPGPNRSVIRQIKNAAGEILTETVHPTAFRRVMTFLWKLPKNDPEQGMALALRSYLETRMDPRDLDNNNFLTKDAKGRLHLTGLGRTALFDIITASDGELIEPLVQPEEKAQVQKASPQKGLGWKNPDTLSSVDAAGATCASPELAFDGKGARHGVGAFDWNNLDSAVVKSGGLTSAAPEMLDGYAIDRKNNTVRVLVAAKSNVSADRLQAMTSSEDGEQVLKETGLNAALFKESGAKVVRAVDNLVAVDVPVEQAAKLGLALEGQGIESRPARVFRAASAALAGPAGSMLGMQLMPVPALNPLSKDVSAQMIDSRSMLKTEGLWKAGMKGQGTLVGVIDTGIDPEHPDFKDKNGKSRVQAYMDFTGEGKDDVIGHGTHVSGGVGGTGAASDGKYAGMAPETRFKVAKVFGTKGETDESVILAAMKWMVSGCKKDRIDVLNMSLGGPGEPNKDPLSSMANHLVVDRNVLVVAAAGNDGAAGYRTVSSPGSSRYALTVTGVNKDGEFPFFVSKGPAAGESGDLYSKPDMSAVAGDVDLKKLEQQLLEAQLEKETLPASGTAGLKAVPNMKANGCVYAPDGVVAPRSSKDPDTVCTVPGDPNYRYMSGTSMATPMVSGMAADVIGYLKKKHVGYDALEIKAALMETSSDLPQPKEQDGAGLANGDRLAKAVTERVARGVPVGNIAYMLAMRLTTDDAGKLKGQNRYQMTPLGLYDTLTGHLVNNEADMQNAVDEIRRAPPTIRV